MDKLDKVGVDGVARELAARGIDAAVTKRCLEVFEAAGPERPADTLRRLEAIFPPNDTALVNLRAIVLLAETTASTSHIRIDLSLARGLSYYTGAIMEIAVADLAGSLGGGGRYDNLIGMFLGHDIPACGFSLGLERIIVVMTERKMFPDSVELGPADVMVTLWNNDSRADALALAADLRGAGLRVEVYPEADKLGKQFKYAASRHVPFVAIVGDDERAQGSVSLKDLQSGDQHTVARGEAAQYVRTRRPA